ncbi:MAG: hypothetical protein GY854_17110 [Deltaproteobacteria bacterium]|nr:hypothetical protein [Deltaproteobacteria bacterium]
MAIRTQKEVFKATHGSVYVEQVVLVVTVAIGFAAAVIPLGAMLLDYHATIEFVLGLPIP